jgi:hypothetical protein
LLRVNGRLNTSRMKGPREACGNAIRIYAETRTEINIPSHLAFK